MIFNVFISRPRLAMVISIIITIAGLVAISVIPVAQYPDIAPPSIQATTNYAGADAETVASSVALPVEDAINGIPGMRYMRSNSSNDGSYSLTITFDLETDPDIAAVNVQNRISLVQGKLPQEVRISGLSVSKSSSDLLQLFAVYSDDDEHDQLFLSNFVTLNIIDELKRIPGVGSASIMGARDYAMRIWIDPRKLADFDLSSSDVVSAIQLQNVQEPAGRIGAAPYASGDQRLQLTITAKGRLKSPEEFAHIVLRSRPDGSAIRVSDVARVEFKAASYDTISRYDGRPAAPIGIYLAPGANAVNVATAVVERLDEIKTRFPAGVKYDYVYNTAEFVSSMMGKVIETLIEAFALVALVVFVFLGRLRPSIVPLIAVPVAIIGAFAILVPMGYSANTISLLALVLAIGIVVDDSIIVVENVERVMEENPGLSPADATRSAMEQIVGPIIAVTLVLLSVFLPVAFLPGSTGVLFRQFAATISAAMLISAINALTLTPALCALLLKRSSTSAKPGRLQCIFEQVASRYASIVRSLLRYSSWGLGAVCVAAAATGYIFWQTPKGFLPSEDKGYLLVSMTLPPAASTNRTDAAAKKVEAVVRRDPAVESALSIIGLDFLTGGSTPNAAIMFVRLKPYELRRAASLEADATAQRLFGALASLPDGSFVALNPPALPGLGVVGGFEMMLEALEGQSATELAAVARGLSVAANQRPELAQVFSGAETDTPQINLEIDRERAQVLGIEPAAIFAELQSTLGGIYVGDFNQFGRSWTVVMQADAEHRANIDDIYKINLKTREGNIVPMSMVAKATLGVGPRSLMRYNNSLAATIQGSAAPGRGDGTALQAMEKVASATLPKGYANEWTGAALEERISAGQTPVVMGLAVLFAFLLLVALYESWSLPVAALLPVIVAVLGAVLGLFLTSTSLLIYTEIGVVVLIALAAKNSILMTQFFIDERKRGRSIVDAAVGGAKQRIRPVLMTSFAFIAALVPLLVSQGPGAASMYSVALPVFCGMLLASVVGIFLIPMMYAVIQHLRERRMASSLREAQIAAVDIHE